MARSTDSAQEETDRTMPRPSQCGQRLGRAFKQARAQPLARHFEQAEMADAAHLDAGAVVLQRLLQAPFDRAVVALLLHVDEVDDDQAGKIAQAQLPGDFVATPRDWS